MTGVTEITAKESIDIYNLYKNNNSTNLVLSSMYYNFCLAFGATDKFLSSIKPKIPGVKNDVPPIAQSKPITQTPRKYSDMPPMPIF